MYHSFHCLYIEQFLHISEFTKMCDFSYAVRINK